MKVKRSRAHTTLTIGDVLEIMLLIGWACGLLFGSMYLAATVPHTLVIVYAKSYPAQLTATLDMPTRTLAPVTVTRSQTAPTTGHDYQSARAAAGLLTVFNGSFSPQRLLIGTVFTGRDGVKVATNAAVIVPAAQPPQFALAQVPASALMPGSSTNIAAGDIDLALTSDLLVKNLTAFTGGRDARTYRAVAQHDMQHVTTATTQQVQQAFPPGVSVARRGRSANNHLHNKNRRRPRHWGGDHDPHGDGQYDVSGYCIQPGNADYTSHDSVYGNAPWHPLSHGRERTDDYYQCRARDGEHSWALGVHLFTGLPDILSRTHSGNNSVTGAQTAPANRGDRRREYPRQASVGWVVD